MIPSLAGRCGKTAAEGSAPRRVIFFNPLAPPSHCLRLAIPPLVSPSLLLVSSPPHLVPSSLSSSPPDLVLPAAAGRGARDPVRASLPPSLPPPTARLSGLGSAYLYRSHCRVLAPFVHPLAALTRGRSRHPELPGAASAWRFRSEAASRDWFRVSTLAVMVIGAARR